MNSYSLSQIGYNIMKLKITKSLEKFMNFISQRLKVTFLLFVKKVFKYENKKKLHIIF